MPFPLGIRTDFVNAAGSPEFTLDVQSVHLSSRYVSTTAGGRLVGDCLAVLGDALHAELGFNEGARHATITGDFGHNLGPRTLHYVPTNLFCTGDFPVIANADIVICADTDDSVRNAAWFRLCSSTKPKVFLYLQDEEREVTPAPHVDDYDAGLGYRMPLFLSSFHSFSRQITDAQHSAHLGGLRDQRVPRSHRDGGEVQPPGALRRAAPGVPGSLSLSLFLILL